ncbi:MAG TPA: dihydroxy-acid dehydratase, partial [Puia sp.]
MTELNKYSKTLTQDETQPGAQAMYYAIGFTEADFKKAQVGIASMGWDGNPCNMHLNDLARSVKTSINKTDLLGLIFHTIGVSDGMSMGTDGMRYSLVSRDIIADSIETNAGAQYYDAIVTIAGCDKNMPGSIMAMGRLNRPGIMLYGGTIAPGHYKGQDLNIVSNFEALGQKIAGNLSEADFKGIVRNSCPGAGACGGMYTANTMACAIEALGMSLPYSSSNPALSADKQKECAAIGEAIKLLLEKDIKPRDIMTRKAFENAITVVMVLGGSTNAVLHLIAMAKSVDVPLTQDDFQTISNLTPMLADFKPSGKYLMEDLHQYGGVPAVMKYLLKNGLLHGECLTVTGRTVTENLQSAPDLDFDLQKIIMPLDKPIKATGHLQILYGNLAEGGSVAKITGKEGVRFEGTARVFDGEHDLIRGIQSRKVHA